MRKFKIIVDSRERRPWNFSDPAPIIKKLNAGDYSLQNLENLVSIERKTIDDFVNTLIKHRKRFFKEVRILSKFKLACIIVEGNLRDIIDKKYVSMASFKSILGLTSYLYMFSKVPIYFCSDRSSAKLYAEIWLNQAYNFLSKH